MSRLKIIIAGGRDFNDYALLKDECDKIINQPCEIVYGGATGADTLGKRYADERGLPSILFEAQWNVLGKKAGPYRNRSMAIYADVLICFWDGKSKGTANMIQNAKEQGLSIFTINYSNTPTRVLQ